MLNKANTMRLGVSTLTVLTLLLSRPAEAAELWTFDLLPSGGIVSGLPGDTVGWGYAITNEDTTNWLVVSGLSADGFLHGTPDSSIFDFPIVAPGATASLPFIAGLQGLYSFTWDAAAPGGFTNAGLFTLSAEWYDGDPFDAGAFVGLAESASAIYSAGLDTQTPAPVPEPASILLFGTGAIGLAARARRRRRSKT